MQISIEREKFVGDVSNVLNEYSIPELGHAHKGKVRDNYVLGGTRLMIATDRVSCFDHILHECIPCKGEVLTRLASFWLQETADIIDNHLISCPDPSAMLCKQCTPLPVEVIVRGYLTGSAWRAYRDGARTLCGVSLPEGMVENEAFSSPIITPTTKAESGHDENITAQEIVATGLVSAQMWKQIEDVAARLFKRGQQICSQSGLILVDTKYEFGVLDGKLMLIDEIHTPDSSRFWSEGGTAHRSKEFVRAWLIENGFMGKEGEVMPHLPEEVVRETAQIYIDLYEQITGESFTVDPTSIGPRLVSNLKKADVIKGYFTPIIMGSTSDDSFCASLQEKLEKYGIAVQRHVASAHKTPRKVLELIESFNSSIEPVVYITVAGRSNGLSGVTAASAVHPVIACPPFQDKVDFMVNINSTLQMPSKTPVLTVVDPNNATLAAARIFANSCSEMKQRMSEQIRIMKQ